MIDEESIKILKNHIKINNNEYNQNDTNCYSYALNIDYPYTLLESYKKEYLNVYKVGTISGIKKVYTKEKLEEALFSDLNILDIDIKKINLDEQLLENEWKIAMFSTDVYYDYILGKVLDFHFIKQNFGEDIWTHKVGYNGTISNLDDNKKLIINPKEFYFEDTKDIFNKNCPYEFINCYKLKKK